MTLPPSRTLCLLLAADHATGAATLPVGVLGVDGDDHHASWVPLEPRADAWKDRLNAAAGITLAERIAFWSESANGLTLDLAQLDETTPDLPLHEAVEAALDAILAAEGPG